MLRKKLLIITFALAGVLISLPVLANTCPSASPQGVGCTAGTYYCSGSCRSGLSWCPTWSPSPTCASGLSCANCSGADSCGVCNSCNSGYRLCGAYPNSFCKDNNTLPSNCASYNTNCDACASCVSGYTLEGGSCVAATLKLGSSSVSGTNVAQGGGDSSLFVSGNKVGIGISAPTSNLQLNSTNNTEGLRIITSNYSPFIIRNINDTADLFRIDQDGNITSLGNMSGSNTYWNFSGSSLFASSTAWNVGIGTTNATEKLTVVGAINSNSTINGLGLCIGGDCKTSWGDAGWAFDGNTVGQTKSFGTLDNYSIPFRTNSVERMRLTETGNLVIGTSTTGVRLHVESPQGAVAFFKSKINGGSYAGYIGNGQTFSGEEFGLYYADGIFDSRLAVYDLSSSLFLYGGHLSTDAPLSISNITGNVGIGKPDPGAKFEVYAGMHSLFTRFSSQSFPEGFVFGHDLWGGEMGLYNGASDQLIVGLNTSNPDLVMLGQNILYADNINKKVGIGTTNPNFELDLSGNIRFGRSSPGYGLLASDLYGGEIGLTDENDVAIAVKWDNGNFQFGGSLGSDRGLFINSSGKAGIGTTNPRTKLHVSNGTNIDTTNPILFVDAGTSLYNAEFKGSGSYTGFMVNNTSAGGVPFVQYQNIANNKVWTTQLEVNKSFAIREGNATGVSRFMIAEGGNIGIGTTNPGTYRLNVSGSSNLGGNLTATGTVSFTGVVFAGGGNRMITVDNAGVLGAAAIASLPAGTTSYTLRYDGSNWVSNGNLFNNGTNVGIGTTTPGTYRLSVDGTTRLNGAVTTSLSGTGNRCVYVDAAGNLSAKGFDCGSATGGDNMGDHSAVQNLRLNSYWLSGDGGSEGVFIDSAGGVGIGTNSITAGLRLLVSGNLSSSGTVSFTGPIYAGGGNRMITVDNAGVLGAAAIPVNTDIYWTGTATNLVPATGRASLGLGSLATLNSVANAQITDVAWSKITGFPAACSAGQYVSAVGGTLTCSTPAGGGSGTINYVSKWTSGTAQGNSIIYDNGTYVGIGTSVPGTYKLNVNGTSYLGGNLTTTGTVSFTGVVFAGGGNRMITVDNAGVLGATALPASLPSGTTSYTLRYDGSSWVSNGNLFNNGTNVGIGTTSPGAKLHVLGNAIISSSLTMGGDINMGGNNITNLNKLTVNTIDPLYNIQGINYSTFASSIVGGVKEEYLGTIKVLRAVGEEYEAVIDFDNVAKGSDLWVWHQVVDFSPENIHVNITPYGSFASVYYQVKGNKLIFRSDRPADLSYRLVGKRLDWRKWPTKALDQQEKAGFYID